MGAPIQFGTVEVTGGTLDTSGNDVTVTNSLTLGEGVITVSEGDTFRVSGSNLAADARISLTGGALSVGRLGAAADTVAYWRFEEGPVDTQATVYQGDWYLDSSGNGNHLWTWSEATAPMYTDQVPFAAVPQTGVENQLALDYTPSDDLYTMGKPINSMQFDQLTVEVSVKLDTLDRWQVFVGKDGKPIENDGSPPFFLKFQDQRNEFEAVIIDGSGTPRWFAVDGLTPEIEKWYHLALTNDGTTARLYIKGPDDDDYVEHGSQPTVGGLVESDGPWTVGRGQWNGNNADWTDGMIDEVRISSRALDPSEFLGALNLTPPDPLDLASAEFAVSADSTLQVLTYDDAMLGKLTLADGVALTVQGPASFGDVVAGDGSSVDGVLLLRGTLSLSAPGTFTVDGEMEMDDDAGYLCTIAGATNDLIDVTADMFVAGSLSLQATASLDALGDSTRTIASISGDEGAIVGTFASEPAAGDHLGSGVFLQGVSYPDMMRVDVDLFQAAAGDTDVDGDVDNGDLQQILGAGSFGSPGDWDWGQGDFNGDGAVNNGDLQLILATGLFGTGTYAATAAGGPAAVPEPGTALLLALGGLCLLIWRRRRRVFR